MPLARIRAVVDLDRTAAAEAVTAYWDEVVRETANRGQLAAFLVDYLQGRGSDGSNAPLGIRYAARTDRGKVRPSNADAAYAGRRLLAVADGVADAAGERASKAAIEALKPLQTRLLPAGELLNALAEAVREAERTVRGIAASTADGEAVTTLTALLWSDFQLRLVHIGYTRAYLLRDGELPQITHDHTVVQSLVDEGKLSPDEAESHPRRAFLERAITGCGDEKPDLSLHAAGPGDRYLLCSDGLTRVVPIQSMRAVLGSEPDPEDAVEQLIALAYQAGAPDNIACVVADVVAL